MNQPFPEGSQSVMKILILAIVILVGIFAVFYLGREKDIDFTLSANPKKGAFEIGLQTGKKSNIDPKGKEDKRVEVHQESDAVKGGLTGVKAENSSFADLPGSIEVKQQIGSVEKGGKVTGLDLSKKSVRE